MRSIPQSFVFLLIEWYSKLSCHVWPQVIVLKTSLTESSIVKERWSEASAAWDPCILQRCLGEVQEHCKYYSITYCKYECIWVVNIDSRTVLLKFVQIFCRWWSCFWLHWLRTLRADSQTPAVCLPSVCSVPDKFWHTAEYGDAEMRTLAEQFPRLRESDLVSEWDSYKLSEKSWSEGIIYINCTTTTTTTSLLVLKNNFIFVLTLLYFRPNPWRRCFCGLYPQNPLSCIPPWALQLQSPSQPLSKLQTWRGYFLQSRL